MKSKPLDQMTDEEIKEAVIERYGQVAIEPRGKFNFPVGRRFAESVGYSRELLDSLPVSMVESFTGAGHPQPFMDIVPAETILDLGCGAGLDLYLYATATGPQGKVYGLDLSEAMIRKARTNMEIVRAFNVEFLHASADKIPLPDQSVDLVTANGIYNLSPNKLAVIREVARVLRPGGRTIFAEIILKSELPQRLRLNIDDWFRCVGGALPKDNFIELLVSGGLCHSQILWTGRNARTSHALALSAVIRAERQK